MKTYLPLPVSLLLLALAACQTTSNTSRDKPFAEADINKDGKLAQAEASSYFVAQIFEGKDVNHDGSVSLTEWAVPGAKQNRARFDSYDTNKDGSVTRIEALTEAQRKPVFAPDFKKADKDKDGYLTPAEIQAHYAAIEGPVR